MLDSLVPVQFFLCLDKVILAKNYQCTLCKLLITNKHSVVDHPILHPLERFILDSQLEANTYSATILLAWVCTMSCCLKDEYAELRKQMQKTYRHLVAPACTPHVVSSGTYVRREFLTLQCNTSKIYRHTMYACQSRT